MAQRMHRSTPRTKDELDALIASLTRDNVQRILDSWFRLFLRTRDGELIFIQGVEPRAGGITCLSLANGETGMNWSLSPFRTVPEAEILRMIAERSDPPKPVSLSYWLDLLAEAR